MRNILLLLSLILLSGGCFAAFNTDIGGFHDSINANKTNVVKALKMNDSAYVTLQGNIEKQLSDDSYLFKDLTGSIIVEIDKDKWLGQNITPKDKIEITGKIEKKFNYIKIDVYSVRKLAK